MTYQESESLINANRSSLKDKAGLRYKGVVIATDNADFREQIRVFKKVMHEGWDNKFVLEEPRQGVTDWGVFVVCEDSLLQPKVFTLKEYLAI